MIRQFIVFLFIELPELEHEMQHDIHQTDHADQTRACCKHPDHQESTNSLGHQGIMRLDSLVEVSHVPTCLPHDQQDFSVLFSLLLPQPLQV